MDQFQKVCIIFIYFLEIFMAYVSNQSTDINLNRIKTEGEHSPKKLKAMADDALSEIATPSGIVRQFCKQTYVTIHLISHWQEPGTESQRLTIESFYLRELDLVILYIGS